MREAAFFWLSLNQRSVKRAYFAMFDRAQGSQIVTLHPRPEIGKNSLSGFTAPHSPQRRSVLVMTLLPLNGGSRSHRTIAA